MKIELSTLEMQALAAAIVAEALKTLAPRLDALEKALLQRALPSPTAYVQSRQEVSPVKATKTKRDMLKRGDLQDITGLSASTIARLESKGQFPSRVQLSSKRVAWRRVEVEAWAEERRLAA